VLRPRYGAVYQIRRRSATILVSTRVIASRRKGEFRNSARELGVTVGRTQGDRDGRSSPHNLPHCTILPIQFGFGKLRHKALALRRELATSRRFRGARIAKILRAGGVETDRRHRRTSAFGLRRLGMMAATEILEKSSTCACGCDAAAYPIDFASAFELVKVRFGNESDKGS
jgi:hypothetical protein